MMTTSNVVFIFQPTRLFINLFINTLLFFLIYINFHSCVVLHPFLNFPVNIYNMIRFHAFFRRRNKKRMFAVQISIRYKVWLISCVWILLKNFMWRKEPSAIISLYSAATSQSFPELHTTKSGSLLRNKTWLTLANNIRQLSDPMKNALLAFRKYNLQIHYWIP